MADIRCPMCDKPNPEELEICQYCQARLKPLAFAETGASESELPDWLRSDMSLEDEQKLPDWLDDIRSDSGEAFSDREDVEANLAADQALVDDLAPGEEPDWLARVRSRMLEDNPAATFEPDSETTRIVDENELSKWLELASPEEGAGEPQTLDTDQALMPAGLAWLAWEETSKDLAEAEPTSIEGTQQPQESETPAAPTVEVEEPEIEAQAPPESTDVAFPAPAPVEEGLPDWLVAAGAAQVLHSATGDEPQAALPDWLPGGMPAELPQGLEEAPPATEILPAVIEDAQAGVVAPDEEFVAPSLTQDQAEILPDWLFAMEAAPDLSPVRAAPEPEEGYSWIDKSALVGVAAGLAMGGEAGERTVPEAEPDEGLDISTWLASLEQEINPPEQATFPEAAPVEVAAMLAEAAPIPPEPQAGTVEAPAAEAGELPGWLEVMRPVAAAAGAASILRDEGTVEGSGPLAGLKGILPAEPGIFELTKPKPYLIKLQVSDSQQTQAALFEEIIRTEGDAKATPGKPVITSQHILRIGIAILLALAILWPVITGGPEMPPPLASPDTFGFEQLILSAAAGKPALVAVDYQPGRTAEMELAAAGVINQLLKKDIHLALVSTSATGAVQAERLVAAAGKLAGQPYSAAENYTNLGYIPGEATGLQAFARSPRMVFPQALDGSPAWERAGLQSVQSAADFRTVLVITDSPDTARAWIEQVRPQLNGRPLIMVASAQAGALVRPYYLSRQIDGLLVGLEGGIAYQNLHDKTVQPGIYWNAFNLAILAAALVILVGGIVNIGMAIKERKQAPAREGQP